jgi:rubrerythrin
VTVDTSSVVPGSRTGRFKMVVSSYTLQKILERAIEKEIDSQNLYVTLSNLVKDQYARDALLDLVKYEKEHQVLLERYQRGELKEGALRRNQPIDYKIAEKLEQAEVSADMHLKDIFMLAARREKASHEFYLSLAGIHPEGKVRSMLEQLASQELEHKQKVEFLYTEVAFPQTDGG